MANKKVSELDALTPSLGTDEIYVIRGGNPYRMTLAAVNTGGAFVDPPDEADSTGTAGEMAYDNFFFYICTATDVWRRVPISSWTI